jgi:hypothetical protein
METSDPRLAALASHHEIAQVILRLARATDRRDAEAIRRCYHADGHDDHGAFRGSAAEFAEWVPKVLAPFAATQHVVGPPRIELDGEVADVEIARRRCVWDYTYVVPAHDKWPLGPDFQLGRPDRTDPSYPR